MGPKGSCPDALQGAVLCLKQGSRQAAGSLSREPCPLVMLGNCQLTVVSDSEARH